MTPSSLIKQAKELEDKLRYVLHTGEMNREAYRLLPRLASELEKALVWNEIYRIVLEKIESSPVYNHYDRKPNTYGEFTNTHVHCGECLTKKSLAQQALHQENK